MAAQEKETFNEKAEKAAVIGDVLGALAIRMIGNLVDTSDALEACQAIAEVYDQEAEVH